MKLSVCLIVKNEEDVIDRCLGCVNLFADEIVVVDTGSTDNTKTIASKYTNMVFDFKWVDDFSKARNFSFSKASGDYVMWMDADDVLEQCEIDKLIELKSRLTADTYMLKYAIAFNNNGEGVFSYYRERILKRGGQSIWQGFIHEVISPFGKIEYVDITIKHKKEKPSDPKRNLKIYKKQLKAGVNLSAREQYYYAKELFYNGYYRSTILAIKKYLNMPNKFTPNLVDAYVTLGKCYMYIVEYEKALNVLFMGLKDVNPNSEYLCGIGDIFLKQQKYNQAVLFYEIATTLEPNFKSGEFINKEYYYLYPYLQLTMIHYKLGNVEKSKKYHNLAKKCDPQNASVIYNEQFFTI